MSQSLAMPTAAAYTGAPVTYAAPTYGAPATAAQYVPAAATAQGYAAYQQYAQSPQYTGAVLTQQQYIQADTNHDGVVSQGEIQAMQAQPVKHGLFGQHHGFGIYDHFVNHGAGAAQLAAQAQAAAPTTAPAPYYAAAPQGYQQYMQYAQSPQYHCVQLTQQQYMAADTNHDGRITQGEIQAAQVLYANPTPASAPAGGSASVPAYTPAPAHTLPTAGSMVAYPAVQTYAPQYQAYQQQYQFAGQPQLTAAQFAQADTNHDGKVSKQEIATEVAPVAKDAPAPASKPPKKKKASKKKKSGCC